MMRMPVPPLAEQHAIVRRVEALFRLADAIEARVAAGAAPGREAHPGHPGQGLPGELVSTEAERPPAAGRPGNSSPRPCSWRALKKSAA